MPECSPDAFALANRTETPMNVVAVIQHTSGEYLGLMEDHLEGRRIRFQYFRPFAGGGKIPSPDIPADALILLGGGPWGSAGVRDLPTLEVRVALGDAERTHGFIVLSSGFDDAEFSGIKQGKDIARNCHQHGILSGARRARPERLT